MLEQTDALPEAMARAFLFFRDSPQRRRALAAEPGSAERYVLYGLDQLPGRGFSTRHNLERESSPPRWARVAARAMKAALE